MSTPLEPVDSVPPKKVDPIDNLTENLQLFWFKHQKTIYTCVTLVLLAIVGKGAYDWNKQRVERLTGEEYAAAGASMDKLRAFAASHEGHILAGASLLRLADDAYSLGKYSDAAAAYGKALAVLKDSPFAGRARLGQAVSNLLGGKADEGVSALKLIADDLSAFKGLRAEAAYHLVVAGADAGRADDVRKYSDLLLQLDSIGVWSPRAMALRATLPEPAAPAAGPASDSVLKLSLPGAK